MLLRAAMLIALALAAGPGCKSVCQKFADHLEDCRVEYCTSRAEHPICGERYQQRDNRVSECPDAIEAIVEDQLDKDCATLAREMGWEALGHLPTRQPE